MKRAPLGLAIVVLAGTFSQALAQQLPLPSRTVYKCEAGGKTVYSDEPCPAAKRIDVEPTRGLTTTGRERNGSDVQREIHREQFAEAVRPLTGMDSKQYQVATQRVKLPAEAQRECKALDASLPRLEAMEVRSHGAELEALRANLLKQRKRFRELRC